MILVTASKIQRLLCLKFSGRVTAEEMRSHAEEIRSLLADLPSGFRLLSDLEHLESMERDCVGEIGKFMDLFKASGIELVVRIIPEPEKDIGLNILSVFRYGRQMRTVTCETFPEAARVLKL